MTLYIIDSLLNLCIFSGKDDDERGPESGDGGNLLPDELGGCELERR